MNQAVYDQLFHEKDMTEDSEKLYYLQRDKMAKRYGWTLGEIDNLGLKDLAVTKGIMAGESRFMAFKIARDKHKRLRGKMR